MQQSFYNHEAVYGRTKDHRTTITALDCLLLTFLQHEIMKLLFLKATEVAVFLQLNIFLPNTIPKRIYCCLGMLGNWDHRNPSSIPCMLDMNKLLRLLDILAYCIGRIYWQVLTISLSNMERDPWELLEPYGPRPKRDKSVLCLYFTEPWYLLSHFPWQVML